MKSPVLCKNKGVGRFFFLCGILLVSNLWAQLLEVRLSSGRDNFVLDEQVIVSVSIRNNSDQLAVLANEKNWIQFTVSQGKGVPVAKKGNPPEGEVFVLKAGAEIEREFRLDPFFDFTSPSEYIVSAQVTIPNWGNVKVGAIPARFQVMQAHDMAVLERGVSTDRGGVAPEVRRYTLQKARVNGKLFMYMRVSDDNNPNFKVYNVLALGVMVHMPRPSLGFEIDASGIVHVFFQCHARNYLYCTMNSNGKLIGRQMYIGDGIRGRPRMEKIAGGKIQITGGQKSISAWDYPRSGRESTPAKRVSILE